MSFKRKKTIKEHEYWYEVKNVWTKKGARQKVLKYLGKGDYGMERDELFKPINVGDIKQIAKKKGVPFATIEKDYMLTAFMGVLSRHKFFDVVGFKGGTALAMIYLNYHRFSEDLDFSADSKNRKKVVGRIHAAAEDMGLKIKKERLTKKSYLIKLGYKSPYGHKDNLQVDVHFRKTLLPFKDVVVKSKYRGLPSVKVRVYDFREMVTAKIGAMVNRAEPRDFYDVWYLLKHKRVNLKEIRPLVYKKCDFSMEKVFEGEEHVEKQWKSRLERLVPVLPPLKKVKGYLNKKLKTLA